MAKVDVEKEVYMKYKSGWKLCLQYGTYKYDDNTTEKGYRFIWRKPDTNHLQPARGQARIPSIEDAKNLIQMAITEGWGEY